MKAEEFDVKFDSGQDVTEFLDFSTARRPNREPKTIELTLPAWRINQLKTEANNQGISAQTFLENDLTQHISPIA